MVKVRLWGTVEEMQPLIEYLKRQPRLRVMSVSGSCKDRGESEYSRIYIEVEMLSDVQAFERLKLLGNKK